MHEDTNTADRALGRMEGKLDLLLGLHAADKLETSVRIDSHSRRISELESWKTKASAYYMATVILLGGLWAVIRWMVPLFLK